VTATEPRPTGPQPGLVTGRVGDDLASKTMGTVEVLAQSAAGIAPSAVMATGPALIVLSAGSGTWVSYVFAMVTVLLIGFGNHIASAGSLYSYVANSLGSEGAFAAGWGLVIGYACIAMVGVAGVGIYLGSLLTSLSLPADGTPGLVVIFALAALAAAAFALAGIKLSVRLGLVLEVASVLALLLLFVAVLAKHGLTFDHAQLRTEGSSFNGITFGIVLATLGFVGFESAASLGAEARDPHRAIPRAVLSAAVIVGVLYVFAAYVTILGLGADSLGASAAPMDDLARSAGIDSFRYVIDAGVAASFFAVIIASINAAARILYAMAHEQVLPPRFGRTHPKHRTPHVAILLMLPFVGLIPIVMALAGTSALNIYAYTGTIGTFGYITAYILTAAGMPVFLRRRGESAPLFVLLAAVTVLALLYIIYKNLVPVPASPFNLLPYIYLAVLAVGVAWYTVVRIKSPERARLVGTFEEDVTDGPHPPARPNA